MAKPELHLSTSSHIQSDIPSSESCIIRQYIKFTNKIVKYKLSTSVHAVITSQCILRAITGHGSTLPDHHISFSLTGKDRICYFASMLALGLNEKTPSYQSPCPAKVRATTWYFCRPQVKEMIQAKQYNKTSKPAFSTC